jgi:hypothetical protein
VRHGHIAASWRLKATRLGLGATLAVLGGAEPGPAPAAARADSLALTIPQPLPAGTLQTDVSATGVTQPDSGIAVWVTVKRAGRSCAKDPNNDQGDVLGSVATTSADDGSFTWQGPLFAQDIDAAGAYLFCGWLVVDGTVTATTRSTVTVAKPVVKVSVGGAPAKLPASKFEQVTMGTVHFDVGSTTRSLITFVQPAKTGCGPVDQQAANLRNFAKSISGKSSYAVQTSVTPADGVYVVCAYVGDQTGKEVDGHAASSMIVVGRGNAPPPAQHMWLGQTSRGEAVELQTTGGAVTGFDLPRARLSCAGTHPSTTYVDWFLPVLTLSAPIDRGGRFHASLDTGRGNKLQVTGTFAGKVLHGTLTDVLHPTRASGITLDAAPHTIVTGGVCRAARSFAARRR